MDNWNCLFGNISQFVLKMPTQHYMVIVVSSCYKLKMNHMICDLELKWFFAPIIALPTHMIQSYINNFKFIIASKGEYIYILQLYGAP